MASKRRIISVCIFGPALLVALTTATVLIIGPRSAERVVLRTLRLPAPAYSLAERLAEIGPAARARLALMFAAEAVSYPPTRVALVAYKAERRLDLWAASEHDDWQVIHRLPILAASGGPGPKLREGDRQVPEGLYRISFLNPNSRFDVSMRIDYPNAFDRARAADEGRDKLGGDIMIHGNALSIGCLAMGDQAAEDLFVLASDTGLDKIKVIIAPTEIHGAGLKPVDTSPAGVGDLYRTIETELATLKSAH